MPGSRQYRDHGRGRGRDREYDDSDYDSGGSRERIRPQIHHRSSSYDDRYRHERRPRGAGSRRHDDYIDRHDDDLDDEEYGSPPPRRRRRHTRSEERSYRPRRGRSTGRSRSRGRGQGHDRPGQEELARGRRDQAIKSALTAGAVEAFRQRNRSGEWMGEKGLRVATAAMSAAAIDSAVDKNPRRKGKRNVIGATLGGLLVDKLASGIRGR